MNSSLDSMRFHPSRRRWAKLGLAGLLFFLVKGLAWLILAAAFWVGASGGGR